jgi:hypothetical protein
MMDRARAEIGSAPGTVLSLRQRCAKRLKQGYWAETLQNDTNADSHDAFLPAT